MASDPIRYIAMVRNTNVISIIYSELEKSYVLFADNNGLYNSILRLLGILSNSDGYKATSLLITLPQTLFGILTIQTVFRILSIKFVAKKAFKYTLIYAFLSLTLLYSGIIVRDIVIAFLFAICIEVVLKPFKIQGVIIIILMMLFCIGIRLYSGLFISLFLFYYLFFNVKSSTAKIIIYPSTIIAILIIGSSAFFNDMSEKTTNEIDTYSQWQTLEASNSDGFSGMLRKLPEGISNIALGLYSQMNPFPPYSTLMLPNLDFPQTYMAGLMTISSIWWFFISYSLLWLYILKYGYLKLGGNYNFLYAIAWLLILVSCTMHVDIRRLIPVYPIIYFLYVYSKNYLYGKQILTKIQLKLGVIYVSLNLLYLFIR